MNSQNQNPNDLNEQWEEDRKNKEMRLWETGAKGNIIFGWWEIVRSTIIFVVLEGLFIYLWWANQLPAEMNFWIRILIIAMIFLGVAWRIGLGIWKIYLGKSKLQRQKWTWWFSIITMPLAYIYFIFYFFNKTAGQTTPLVQILIICALTLGFGALYYYTFSIKRKFEPEAVEPIKEELQELSRWPLSKDRPFGFFIIGILMLLLSIPTFGLAAISFTKNENIYFIIGLLLCISIFIAGIGLMRAKKYGIIFAILSTIFLAIMALIEKNEFIYFHLIGVVFHNRRYLFSA